VPGDPGSNIVGYWNNMIRYYLHMDPGTLTDEQWAETINQLADIRKKEAGIK